MPSIWKQAKSNIAHRSPIDRAAWLSGNSNPVISSFAKIRLGEHGSDLHFPRARASEYSAERGQAYLLSSEWVQEFPCRSGRHARFQVPESNRFSSSPGRNPGSWALVP